MAFAGPAAYDVAGLGLATVDHLALISQPPEPDGAMEAQAMDVQGGGPVATALVALARLGARTAYLGTLAGDSRGEFALEEFRRCDVDVSATVRVPDTRSVMSIILVNPPYRSIVYNLGNVPDLLPQQVSPNLVCSARILHLDGCHRQAAMEAARIAREAGVWVSLDGGAGELWHGLEEMVRLTDVLVVAREFARMYTDEEDVEKAGPKLLDYGARIVGITDGLNGSWIWTKEEHFHQPAYQVEVVDTTGAGDVYHGAFLFGLLQAWPLRQVASFASATAALKCGKLGGRAGIPSRDQVEAFLGERDIP